MIFSVWPQILVCHREAGEFHAAVSHLKYCVANLMLFTQHLIC